MLATIPLDRIAVQQAFNPRRHFDPGALQRLADSIRAEGLIQPITVRPRPDGEGYWLIAGERRFRALNLIGATEVAANVRECDDTEARRLALLENLDRQDIGPGEEARSVRKLLDAMEGDREEVARRLGWTPRKLASRMALLQASEAVLDALDQGQILLGHAELLATLPEESQAKALPRIIERQITVETLREELQGFSIRLDTAIFDVAGCQGCPFNSSTSNQQELFGTHIESGRCTGRDCFNGKTRAAIEAKAVALREDYALVALASESEAGASIPLAAEGPAGVGAEQLRSGCAGCRFRGAQVQDRLGPTCGQVIGPLCYNLTCHSEKVAAAKAAIEAARQPAQAPAAPIGAPEATPVPSQGSAKPKASTPKPAAAAAPARVIDQHGEIVRRAVLDNLTSQPTWILALALAGVGQLVKDATGLSADKVVGSRKNYQSVEERIGELAGLDKGELQLRLVRAATELFAHDVGNAGAGRTLKRRALATRLVEGSGIDLAPHVAIDKAFLEAHTRAAIDAMCDESGFTAWLEQQEEGKAKLKTLRGGDRKGLIDGILAAGFDWTGYRPSALAASLDKLRKDG
jgi:ParB family transcriptional regulator, chromosome partitioning protein